ncbi:MAG: exo-alpha-sialidase [Phycisphaerales bacterium]|nr:MAG: exo-alpha-sialidase [Phycisphaerales bacterium]
MGYRDGATRMTVARRLLVSGLLWPSGILWPAAASAVQNGNESGDAAAAGAAQSVNDNSGAPTPAVAPPPASAPATAFTLADRQIRLARSGDGVTFQDEGLFLARARSPEVVALSGNRLLALFDHAVSESSARTVICRSVSADGGRTWSHPEPIRFDRDLRVQPFAPALLVGPEDVLRLYFLAETDSVGERQGGSIHASVSGERHGALIHAALSRDALNFTLDADPVAALPAAVIPSAASADAALPAAALAVGDEADRSYSVPSLTAAVFDRRFHLFATIAIGADERSTRAEGRATFHYVSADGRRFDGPPQRVRSPAPVAGTIFADRVPLRACVVDDGDVVTLRSPDGRTWTPEPGVRLGGGRDAAVAQATSGGYVMLYVPVEGRGRTDGPQIATADIRMNRQIVDAFTRAATRRPSTEGDGARAGSADALATEASQGRPAGGADGDADDASGTMADPPPFPLPPHPKFSERVDYVAWHRTHMRAVPENAYYAYAAFFPDELHPETSPPDWPEGVNMFSDDTYHDPQGPWRPDERPAWEETYQLYAGLREQYRQASLVPDYIQPPMFGDEVAESADDGRPLLMEMLLPNLSRHRTMAKDLIASAWRVGEDGRVSPDDMLEAWRTTLRGANHLNSSVTLIEHLVALAEQALVQQAARRALVHGVFEGADMEIALDTLLEYDRGVSPSRFLQGEYACAMDTIQYMFTPADEEGRPRLNPKRAERVMEWTGDEQMKESLANLRPEDAYASIDAFDAHYRELARMMERGYPDVRTSDIRAFEEKSVESTALQKLLTPALSRVHTLRARSEASRRATQLSYAVHLFKAAHGRWPDSLDELPAGHGQRMKTDPFTGMNFGYRVDADGPTIYSLSENGVDDGGGHAPRWGDAPDETASDDHVFWPPQG